MNRDSILNGNRICEECDCLVQALEIEIENYQRKILALTKLSDLEILGESSSALKFRNNELIDIIRQLIDADELEIKDIRILCEQVSGIYINGDEVLTNIETARREAESCENTASSLSSAAAHAVFPWEASSLRGMANASRSQADSWNRIRRHWEEQRELYDMLDNEMYSLFSAGMEIHHQIRTRITNFKRSGKMSSSNANLFVVNSFVDNNGKLDLFEYAKEYLIDYGFTEEEVEKILKTKKSLFSSFVESMRRDSIEKYKYLKRMRIFCLVEKYDFIFDDLKGVIGLTEEECEVVLYDLYANGELDKLCDWYYSESPEYMNYITMLRPSENISPYNNLEEMRVYGLVGTFRTPLTQQQINANAEYIYAYLRNVGWSKEAICGLMGNISRESGFNPGTWEELNNSLKGYGLFQFTAWNGENAFFEYLETKGYSTIEQYNNLVEDDAKTMLNYQLEFMLMATEWYYDGAYSIYFEDLKNEDFPFAIPEVVQMPFSDFVISEESPQSLALIFNASYERSNDSLSQKEVRINAALEWYEYFEEYE